MAVKYDSIADIPGPLVALWDEATDNGEAKMELDSPGKANSMRTRLYVVRKALLKGSYPASDDLRNYEVVVDGKEVKIRLSSWMKPVEAALEAVGREAPKSLTAQDWAKIEFNRQRELRELDVPKVLSGEKEEDETTKALREAGYVVAPVRVNPPMEGPVDPRTLKEEE